MSLAEFDQYADEYLQAHRGNIAITGEDPEFFAEYKVRTLRDVLERSGIVTDRIIDFGAGIGASMPFFRKYFPAATLICADASPRSLELAAARFPGGASFVEVAQERVPVDDASVDLAFSACVFHHIEHDRHVHWLTELHRVTSPGGRLAIFEHNPFNPLTVRAVNTCPFDANARLIRASSLVRAAKAAGWISPQIRYHVFFPRVLARLRGLEPSLSWLPLGGQYSMIARK